MKKLLFLLLCPLMSLAQNSNVDGGLKTVTATGTNTYTISEVFPQNYDPKERFLVRFTNGNTGAATLNRNSLGAKPIQWIGGVDLSSGSIQNGETKLLSYNGTYYQIIEKSYLPTGHIYIGSASNTISDAAVAQDGTLSSTGNLTVTGLLTKSLPSLSTGFLKYSGSAWIFDPSTYLTSYTETDPVVKAINGLVKSNGTIISAAISGTDYAPATSGTNLLKGNGSGGFSNATSGTDYAPATSGTSILKGNGSGGFSNAVAGTDYQAPTTTDYTFTTTSGGGTQTAVTIGTTSNKNIIIIVKMLATEVSGGTAGWGSWVMSSASYKNLSGTLTQIGSTDAIISHANDASSPTLSFGVSGSNILIQVTPGSGIVYNTSFRVEIIQL